MRSINQDNIVAILTPPQPSWLNKASLIELSCSILAEDVVLALLPLFPLPAEGPFEFGVELGGLVTPLFPLPALFVPKQNYEGITKQVQIVPIKMRIYNKVH